MCACLKKKWTDKTSSGDQFKNIYRDLFAWVYLQQQNSSLSYKTRGVLKLALLKQQHLKELPQPPAEMLYVFAYVCIQSMLWKQVCQVDCDIVNVRWLCCTFLPLLPSSLLLYGARHCSANTMCNNCVLLCLTLRAVFLLANPNWLATITKTPQPTDSHFWNSLFLLTSSSGSHVSSSCDVTALYSWAYWWTLFFFSFMFKATLYKLVSVSLHIWWNMH